MGRLPRGHGVAMICCNAFAKCSKLAALLGALMGVTSPLVVSPVVVSRQTQGLRPRGPRWSRHPRQQTIHWRILRRRRMLMRIHSISALLRTGSASAGALELLLLCAN